MSGLSRCSVYRVTAEKRSLKDSAAFSFSQKSYKFSRESMDVDSFEVDAIWHTMQYTVFMKRSIPH